MIVLPDATTEEREAISTPPTWRVDATYGGCIITAYTGTDFNEVRKRIGDMTLAADTSAVDVYRNGTRFRHIDIVRGGASWA